MRSTSMLVGFVVIILVAVAGCDQPRSATETDQQAPRQGEPGGAPVAAEHDGPAVAAHQDLQCRGQAEIHQFAPLAGSSDARGSVAICPFYSGGFELSLSLEGLQPGATYLPCINGSQGQPGNDALIECCQVNQGEGYADLPAFQADRGGAFDGVLKLPQMLPQGDYKVRVFLKEQQGFSTILQVYPGVKFAVTPADVVEILEPRDGAEVRGPEVPVRGIVNDRHFRYVMVLVNPLLSPDKYWVQPEPMPDKSGAWQSLCYLGTKGQGVGGSFRLIAFADRSALPGRPGDVLGQDQVRALMEQHECSDFVNVKRVE